MLISWLDPAIFTFENKWDVVDMFAGDGRIARMARRSGQRSVALDLLYSQNTHCFDINEDAGFVLLALGWVLCFMCAMVGWDLTARPGCRSSLNLRPQPRLALKSLLEGGYGRVMGAYGVCCSSWVTCSRGSTKRSILTPMGCVEYDSVAKANKMVSRCLIYKCDVQVLFLTQNLNDT